MASRTKAAPEPRSSRTESRANGDYGEDAARRAEAAAAQAAQDRDESARLLDEARQEREVAEDVAAGTYGPLPPPPPGPMLEPTSYALTQADLTLDAWQDRLDQLEPDGGVYVRVSRLGEHGGDLIWLCNLADPQGGIEEEIERAAQAKGQAGPAVRVRLQPVSRRTKRYVTYQDGRSSIYELTLAIAPAPPASAVPAAAVAVDPLLGAKTIVETAQALTPKATGADPLDIATKMVGLLRPGDSLSDKLLGMLVTALPTLKELLAPKPSPLENAMAELVKQRLTRELGGADERPDLVDEVDKIRAVVDVLKPLVGGGAGEPRTVGLALLETLPEVVRHLAAPLDKFADAYRWRVMHGVAAPSAPVAGAAAVLPAAVAGLWRDVEGAARLNDHGFFPVLLRRLGETFQGGTEFLAAMRAGQVSDAQGLEQFRTLGGADTPATRQYLVTFFNWLRADRVATPPSAPLGEPRLFHSGSSNDVPHPAAGPIITTASPNGPGPQPGVVGRCEGCGDEIDFDDEPTFQARGGEPCEACGGRVVRL